MYPKVSILMAIYKPNIDWLIEQIKSLDCQTYSNIDLLVWNDCPEDLTDYSGIYKTYLHRIPFSIVKGEKNCGSNKAFERLTKMAKSDYVAYCDQDDVWLPDKIETLVAVAESTGAKLVCGDMFVIDGNSKLVAKSISEVRPHHVFYDGKDQFEFLCSRNFVVGCTTLVETSFAKKVVPFPDEFVHDWWLALNAALDGRVIIVKKQLIKYRIHGNNQTGVMTGVVTKGDYLAKRIRPVLERGILLLDCFKHTDKLRYIQIFYEYAKSRENYFLNHNLKNLYTLLKYRNINRITVFFEVFLPFIPQYIFGIIIKQLKNGTI